MKKSQPILIVDLRFQVDHVKPKKFNFLKYSGDPDNSHIEARFSTISIRRKEQKLFFRC